MAFFKRMSTETIRQKFTHYGLFWGCVPVYVNMKNSNCPDVVTRNWIPDWTLDIADWISAAPIFLITLINPSYEPMFAIKLTGLIEDIE
ncbi:hypothetical protein KD625_004232 [Salmonella enterica subsp. enterica serovar Bonariensis]|nr:hypothetical protein [Salmonella enterica subsp. enterica serovar Bonariensis]